MRTTGDGSKEYPLIFIEMFGSEISSNGKNRSEFCGPKVTTAAELYSGAPFEISFTSYEPLASRRSIPGEWNSLNLADFKPDVRAKSMLISGSLVSTQLMPVVGESVLQRQRYFLKPTRARRSKPGCSSMLFQYPLTLAAPTDSGPRPLEFGGSSAARPT